LPAADYAPVHPNAWHFALPTITTIGQQPYFTHEIKDLNIDINTL